MAALRISLLETRIGGRREVWQRILIRLGKGFGTTAVFNGVLSWGYQVVAKSSDHGWVRRLRQQLGSWQPTWGGRLAMHVSRAYPMSVLPPPGLLDPFPALAASRAGERGVLDSIVAEQLLRVAAAGPV